MINQSRYILLFCMALFSGFKAVAQLAMPDHVCIGTAKHYQVDPNPIPGSTYIWRIDGVAQVSTIHEIDIAWNAEGAYLLDVQELSKDGCPGPLISGQVFVSQMPTINASVTLQPTCNVSTGCIELSGLPTGNWIINPGNITGSSASVILTGIAAGTYSYQVTNAAGCVSTACPEVIIIAQLPTPIVMAGADATIAAGTSFTLSGSSATDVDSLIWTTTGTGSFNNPDNLHPIYTPSAEDIILGSVTLTLTLTPAGSCPVINDALILTINHLNSGITITKTAMETSFSAVGDIIHYNFFVTNTSNENAYNISVTDPNATITSGSPIGILEAGRGTIVTAVHAVTQADLDAGKVFNTAYLNSSDAEGDLVVNISNTVILNGLQRPQLTITQFATETAYHTVGEIIHYSFEVFNCGNVTVKQITTTDPHAINIEGNPIAGLAPRNTTIVTGEHVITQADIDIGQITNIAYATGIDPAGQPVSDESNAVTLFTNQPAQLVISNISPETSFSAIGDTIHYLLAVRNFHSTVMSNIVVSDPDATITGGSPIYSLAAGKTALVTAARVITQKELDKGKVINVASARGTDLYDFIDQATSNEVTVFARQSPGLTLTKTAEENTYNSVGDLIHYTHEIENSGNVTITGITLTDPNTSMDGSNRIAGLSPGERATLKTIHVISQTDLNIGFVEKTATVTGLDPNSSMIRINSNQVIIKGNRQARMTAGLTVAENSYSLPGEVIHYTIEIKNTGNVTLTNIRLTDLNALFIRGDSISGMAPGATAMVTAEHLVVQADLLAGKLISSVTVSGYQPGGEQIISISNELTILANRAEGLEVTEVVQESGYGEVGKAIHYTITVKNHGKVPVSNITVSDPNAVISGSPTIAVLMTSGVVTMTAIHQVTQQDLDAGLISNNVSIAGTYPDGTSFHELSKAVAVYAWKNSQLTTLFTATETLFKAVGDQINYTIEVVNTGNLSVSDIVLSSPEDLVIRGSQVMNLAPGDIAGLSAVYTITVADLDAGRVVAAVTATGKDPDKQMVSTTSNEIAVLGLQNPELSTTAMADRTSYRRVGDVIHYNIQVKNSGNVSLISTAVTDPNAVIITVRPNTILFPGESFEVLASHIITQTDLDAGKLVSVATSAGFDLKGNTIERKGNAIMILALQRPELIATTATSVTDYKKEGDLIVFTVVVKNIGNVTMSDIFMTDEKVVLDFSRPISILAPGESDSVTAEHRVTPDDIYAGKIVTAGIAHGTTHNNQIYSCLSNEVLVYLITENFDLSNFPNPFTYETTIVFDLPEKGEVILKIYDMAGRSVGQIDKREYNRGRNLVHWQTLDALDGLYILKMYYNGGQTVRMISAVK